MKTIWKYTLAPRINIDIPAGAFILDIQTQNNEPQMWVLVDPGAEKEKRTFVCYGTGHDVPDESVAHVGTFQVDGGSLVFHVFEVFGASPARPV